MARLYVDSTVSLCVYICNSWSKNIRYLHRTQYSSLLNMVALNVKRELRVLSKWILIQVYL